MKVDSPHRPLKLWIRPLLTAASLCIPLPTLATSVSWTSNSDGQWTTPGNWSSQPALPGSADDVTLDLTSGLYTITLSSGTQSINSLTSNENLTIAGGALDLAATSSINGAFDFTGGTLQGAGALTLNSASNTWAAGTMTGTGKITLSAGSSMAFATTGSVQLSRTFENAGTLNWDSGFTLFVIRGTLSNLSGANLNASGGGTANGAGGSNAFSNAGTLTKSGANTLTFNTGLPFTNNGVLNVQQGTLTINGSIPQLISGIMSNGTWNVANNAALNLAAAPNITIVNNTVAITLDGASSSFAKLNSVTTNFGLFTITHGRTFTTASSFNNGGTLTIGPNSTFESTGTLTNSGLIDLASGTLKLDQGVNSSSSVRAQLRSAYANGAWTGTTGITSTTAAADPTHMLGIGYSVSGSTYTLQLATYGDLNLDNQLNADDYAALDRAFAKSLADPRWTDGDLNYDGIVDSQDYLLIDSAFVHNHGAPTPALLAHRQSQFGDAYASNLLATVPEPAWLPFFAAPLLLGPRIRRRAR